jgi:GTPase SAR1 family protein
MQITSGKVASAQKVLVYGPEGIGKSTFASKFPDPLFIDVEGSTKHLDVKRLDAPESWTMLMEEVRFVILNPANCKTLVIDTADWAERLCVAHVCAKAHKDGIEDFGYGKGYTYLAEEFGNLLNLLSEVIDKGINVVLTAHAAMRKFEQPDEMAAYDRWELKLQKKTAPLVKEWCDMVLFANYKTFTVKSENEKPKAAGGKRVLYTTHHPAWDAKNRHELPEELPFDYSSIAAAIGSTPAAPATKKAATKPTAAEVVEALGAEVVEVIPAPAEQLSTEEPKHLTKLKQLMAESGATELDVQRAVHAEGYMPLDTPIENYPADFVEGKLIAHWPAVLEVIEEIKATVN